MWRTRPCAGLRVAGSSGSRSTETSHKIKSSRCTRTIEEGEGKKNVSRYLLNKSDFRESHFQLLRSYLSIFERLNTCAFVLPPTRLRCFNNPRLIKERNKEKPKSFELGRVMGPFLLCCL